LTIIAARAQQRVVGLTESVLSAPQSFRSDIEGLRAVAVVLVVLDHLTGRPSGGFIGVDVFFVLSGFLITGLLLKETEAQGRLSFRGFYARRARRILPASVTVLIAVIMAAHYAFRGVRVRETVTDVWWALGFGANVHFAELGTDYFQANRSPSLVQHFWSLAVEEQFYLVWPVVVLVVLSVIGRRMPTRSARLLLLGVIGLASVASFCWAVRQTGSRPAAAYFSTPVRAWELGAGAFVAVAAAAFPLRLGRPWRGPLSLAGVAGIVVAAFAVRSTSGFPAPWAALPVLATGLILVAGLGGSVGRWGVLLTNPLSRYVGRISYSLYLWHWPVIVLVAALLPRKSALQDPIAVLLMVGLSVASYHFVERPLRGLSFGRLRRLSLRFSRAGMVVALGSLACVAAGMGLFRTVPPPAHQSFGVPVAEAAASSARGAKADPYLAKPPAKLATAIATALAADRFAALTPSLDQLTPHSAHDQWQGCINATRLDSCASGSTASSVHTAVVIGDSYAMAWLPAIQAALPGDRWRIIGLTQELCPAADVLVNTGESPPVALPSCDARHGFVVDQTVKLNPALVILASADNTLDRVPGKATPAAAAPVYQAGLEKMIRSLRSPSRHVLTLSPPPASPNLQACATAGSVPARCVGRVTQRWKLTVAAEAAAATATKTSYVDTRLWFCNVADFCPSFIGTMPVRWDGTHLTPAYSASLGPELAAVIKRAMT